MTCNSTQELLSAYLDGMISEVDRLSVEEHLSSCDECSLALSELARSVQYVNEIEDVEPPPWLKQNVMERVHGASGKKSIWRRLFYPLHIKLPFEAVGAALLAVITLYIIQSVQPVLRGGKIGEVSQIPSERTGRPLDEIDQAPSGDIRNIPAPETPESTVPMSRRHEGTATGEIKAEEEAMGEYELKAMSPEPMKKEAASRKRKVIEGYATEDETDTLKPARESKVIMESDGARVSREDMKGIVSYDEGAVKGRVESKAYSSDMRAGPASGTVTGEGIVVHVKDMQRSSKDIRRLIDSLEGEVLGSELFDDRSIIIAHVSEKYLSKLIDELSKLGKLQDDADIEALKKRYAGRITIILESL